MFVSLKAPCSGWSVLGNEGFLRFLWFSVWAPVEVDVHVSFGSAKAVLLGSRGDVNRGSCWKESHMFGAADWFGKDLALPSIGRSFLPVLWRLQAFWPRRLMPWPTNARVFSARPAIGGVLKCNRSQTSLLITRNVQALSHCIFHFVFQDHEEMTNVRAKKQHAATMVYSTCRNKFLLANVKLQRSTRNPTPKSSLLRKHRGFCSVPQTPGPSAGRRQAHGGSAAEGGGAGGGSKGRAWTWELGQGGWRCGSRLGGGDGGKK